MRVGFSLAVGLILLVVWFAAWRRRPMLALGITIGLMLAWLLTVVVGVPRFDEVPLWLPPLPFAVVAVTLFVFGILAWVWGDADQATRGGSDSQPGRPQAH